MALIEAHGLSKTFDTFRLENIDLTVNEGEIVGLVGNNGAGKSTLIKLLLGVNVPTSGSSSVLGVDSLELSRDKAHLKNKIGVVFDTIDIPENTKVGGVSALYKIAYSDWDDAAFKSLLQRFQLNTKTVVKDLSRGMGMKLLLACALAHKPQLLILDEATAGLDPLVRNEILQMLSEFAKEPGHGILMCSHITSDIEKTAARVVCLSKGHLVFDLPTQEITAKMSIDDYLEQLQKEGKL